jgi:hypothetical protein
MVRSEAAIGAARQPTQRNNACRKIDNIPRANGWSIDCSANVDKQTFFKAGSLQKHKVVFKVRTVLRCLQAWMRVGKRTKINYKRRENARRAMPLGMKNNCEKKSDWTHQSNFCTAHKKCEQ